jgi:prepilin-type N-terminal cleavage/methylation domain-containing protein
MKNANQKGFSLIELLIVVVVIGVIAAVAVPAFRKGIWAAQNGNTFATLRTISSTQAGFYSQNERFGRLDEMNRMLGSGLGNVISNEIMRNQYVYAMVPAVPTDAELKNGYVLTATRNVPSEGMIYQYELTQSGEIRQIRP